MNPLDEWIYYFKNNKLPKGFKALGLDKVEKQLKIDAMNTQEKLEYTAYMESMGITKSMFETAKLEGLIEGEIKGELKGEIKGELKANRSFTIRLIKDTDFDNEKIASLVGVEVAFVLAIRKELENQGNQE